MDFTALNFPAVLRPPHFKEEEEKRLARVVHVLCLMIFLGFLLAAARNAMGREWKTLLVLASGATGVVLSFLLCRAWQLVWATRILVFTVLATATVLVCIAGQGIHDVMIMMYPSSLVVASQILPKRSFFAYAAVLILSVAGVVTAELTGLVVNRWSGATQWKDLTDISIILLITSVAVEVLTESLRKSLFRAQRSEETLRSGNVELADHAERLRKSEDRLRESQQMLRTVLDTIPVRVFWKNANLDYIGCNRPFALDAGLSSAEEIIGKSDFDMFWREHAGRFREIDREVIDTGTPKQQYEYSRQSVDGQKVWLRLNKSPLIDPDGNIHGVLGIYEDITAYRKLEAQLRQAQKMEAFGQLAGGVAHDFNNILTVILSHASLLEMGEFTQEKLTQSILQINQAAEKAANLTRQLLAFSRRQILQTIDLDLNEVVGNMTKMLQRLIGENIALDSQYVAGGAPVHADPGMMEQVLMNLVVNSRDAMPKGGRLTLKTEVLRIDAEAILTNPRSRPGKFVLLSVIDSGHGISAENMPRIFEPFFTTKAEGRGTGLGLATVFGIVQQHHGWIEVESEPGRGTSFFIYLPYRFEMHGSDQPGAVATEPPRGTETILLVEDEEQVRFLARSTLELMGYRIFEAGDGREALAIWKENKYAISLLLTDLIMPGDFNGRELADLLQKEKPELKVIFCSGYNDEVLGGDFVLRGNTNFLQKPYNPTRLNRLVRDCIDATDTPASAD